MLNSRKKFRALRDKIFLFSDSCVVRKQISERNKNHNPPPPPFKLNGRSLSHLRKCQTIQVTDLLFGVGQHWIERSLNKSYLVSHKTLHCYA